MLQTKVKTYKSPDAYAKDAPRMAEDGWHVTNSNEQTRPTSCMRFLMLGGIFALIFKPKPRIVVTYQREMP